MANLTPPLRYIKYSLNETKSCIRPATEFSRSPRLCVTSGLASLTSGIQKPLRDYENPSEASYQYLLAKSSHNSLQEGWSHNIRRATPTPSMYYK